MIVGIRHQRRGTQPAQPPARTALVTPLCIRAASLPPSRPVPGGNTSIASPPKLTAPHSQVTERIRADTLQSPEGPNTGYFQLIHQQSVTALVALVTAGRRRVVLISAGPGLASVAIMNRALRKDDDLPDAERAARTAGRAGSVAGALAGSAGSIAALSALGVARCHAVPAGPDRYQSGHRPATGYLCPADTGRGQHRAAVACHSSGGAARGRLGLAPPAGTTTRRAEPRQARWVEQ